MIRFSQAALAAVLLACAPLSAYAAESYDNCTGFIDSLPATITTQGTWCLRKDLSTALSIGGAITVAANNVTIDCNHFKIGGLAAGTNAKGQGIASGDQQNITVRHCAVRGFFIGILLNGGGGHLVENNRVDNSLYSGISVYGDGGLVRDNQVRDIGGAPTESAAHGIVASADIIDNVIEGVFAAAPNSYPYGIMATLVGAEVRGNRVRRLVVGGSGQAVALYANASGITFADNRVASEFVLQGWGIFGAAKSVCTGNTLSGLSTPMRDCQDAGGNASN